MSVRVPPVAIAFAAITLLAPVAAAGADLSAAGMGPVGKTIEAGNRDCPPRGAEKRVPSPVAAQGAVTCAPTGSGPATGYPPPAPQPAPIPRKPH